MNTAKGKNSTVFYSNKFSKPTYYLKICSLKETTCVSVITVIFFLTGQTASCQRPDVTADACLWGCAVLAANRLQSRFLLLPSMFSPYRLPSV